jgi:hypothetical protein
MLLLTGKSATGGFIIADTATIRQEYQAKGTFFGLKLRGFRVTIYS